MTCVASGNPAPSVTWTKLTNDVCMSTVSGPRLMFTSLQPTEVGTWQCEAKGPFGNASKQITISANGKKQVELRVVTCTWHSVWGMGW